MSDLLDCTGISATWCPIHGDCACRRNDSGETCDDNDPDILSRCGEKCPLHSPSSKHGEISGIVTAWGYVEIGGDS